VTAIEIGAGPGGLTRALLATGARRVIAVMAHTVAGGELRLVRECRLPLTARECVDILVTDVALIRFEGGAPVVYELAPGWTLDDVQAISGARLRAAAEIGELDL